MIPRWAVARSCRVEVLIGVALSAVSGFSGALESTEEAHAEDARAPLRSDLAAQGENLGADAASSFLDCEFAAW